MNPLDCNEVWLTCIDWPDYMVSNFGRVLRVTPDRGTFGGLRKLTLGPKGYYVVSLCNKATKSKRTIDVHILVAKAFCKQPVGDVEVNHIDGNPRNNFWRNLEWITHAENMQHAALIDLLGKLSIADVRQIRARAASGDLHRKIAVDYGVHESTINKTVKGTLRAWVI